MFRSGDRGSFGSFGSLWRPNVVAGSATFDDEDDEQNHAARAGTRAVERAVNAASSAPTAAVADSEANARAVGRSAARRGDSSSLDASERGAGGGGGDGSGTSGQGRILFYHKPTLANVPAGDVPDVVPVYLGCPRGNMALGLPLNEAWQGEEHQVRVCEGGGGGLRFEELPRFFCVVFISSSARTVCRFRCIRVIAFLIGCWLWEFP